MTFKRHPICWKGGDDFAALKTQRQQRLSLNVGSEVLSGLGALW
tara:strand:+ start:4719 stop:4850 length:132 start_codon:yes stop_codon:yes gene_type:complete